MLTSFAGRYWSQIKLISSSLKIVWLTSTRIDVLSIGQAHPLVPRISRSTNNGPRMVDQSKSNAMAPFGPLSHRVAPRRLEPKPTPNVLATKWENNEIVRKIYRHKKRNRILLWPEKKQNVITMATLAPNRQAVFDALEIWAPCIDEPKSPPVSWLKSEVWYCQTKSWYLKYSKRSDSKSNQQGIYMTIWHFPLEAKALYEFMGDVDDREAAVNSDAWGVKRFLALLICRWKTHEKVAKEKGTTPNFRIPWQQREIIYNARCLFRSPSLLNFISHRNH